MKPKLGKIKDIDELNSTYKYKHVVFSYALPIPGQNGTVLIEPREAFISVRRDANRFCDQAYFFVLTSPKNKIEPLDAASLIKMNLEVRLATIDETLATIEAIMAKEATFAGLECHPIAIRGILGRQIHNFEKSMGLHSML